MACQPPVSPPTLADWTTNFVYGQMGITQAVLPPTSQYLGWAYWVALDLVNCNIALASPLIYKLCVYNLAASNLINFAQDVPQDPPIVPPALGYFASLRQLYQINSLVVGVVQSASDEGTSSSLAIPDFFKTLSLQDLQYLKDPFGRQYLMFAQRYTTVWGIT